MHDLTDAIVFALPAVNVKGIGREQISQLPLPEISRSTTVAHIQRSYFAQVAEACVNEENIKEYLKSLYSFDTAVRRLRTSVDTFLEIEADQGLMPEYSEESMALIQLYEDRRCALLLDKYLSRKAISRLKLGSRSSVAYAKGLKFDPAEVSILLNMGVEEEIAKRYLEPARPGLVPRVLVMIIEDIAPIRNLIVTDHGRRALAEKRLHIWHISEWQEQLETHFAEGLRTALMATSSIIGPEEDVEMVKKVSETLTGYEKVYTAAVEGARQEARVYYASQEFQKRLEAVQRGEMPCRVVVEQACHTVATKHFSRGISRALKEAGHEVYIHPNCRADQRDYPFAKIVEIARVKPDLVIRNPNGYGSPEDIKQRLDLTTLPILQPLQDLDPHAMYPKFLKTAPLRRADMVLILQQRFRKDILEAGALESQLMVDVLPVEPFDDELDIEESIDVGYVKTLSPNLTLEAWVGKRTGPELETIQKADVILKERIANGETMPLEDVKKLAGPYTWYESLLTAYHEWLSVFFAKAVAECGFSMGLTGANWDKVLPEFALGHAHARDAYFRQFRLNRINLSMNPWNEYHARILDGGSVGAFFLIFKVPEQARWEPLPSHFVPGEHYDTFSTKEELIEKVRYYLDRPKLRREIGANLREVVLAKHTYSHAAELIIGRFRRLLEEVTTCGGARESVKG